MADTTTSPAGDAAPSAASVARVEAQERLIGWMLVNAPGAVESFDGLRQVAPSFLPPHDTIVHEIGNAIDGRLPVSAKSISMRMRKHKGLIELGGHEYLLTLARAAPAIGTVENGKRTFLGELRAYRALINSEEIASIVESLKEASDAGRRPDVAKFAAALQAVIDSDDTGDQAASVLGSASFVHGFVSPEYVVDGMLQRGFLYSLTAPTGAGKTAVALRLTAHTALGKTLAGRDVEQGRVLMLIGENADDVRARWIALAEQMGFFADDIDVHFVPAVFSIRDLLPSLKAQAFELGGFALVVVDTSAAYFEGDDENSNKELGDHARALRALTRLPGTPCVIANCHPTKNAGEDNLLPRGGGAFIAEVDGNLTCSKRHGILELHWQGKYRGPDFEPIAFELATVTSDALRDSKKRHIPTVIARPLSDQEQAARATATDDDMQKLLAVMADKRGASLAALAEQAGWMMAGDKPHKMKVSRLLGDLKKQKLAIKELNAWVLTPAGEKAAKRVQR